MLGRSTTHYIDGYRYKSQAIMDWDLSYSSSYSGIGKDRGWYQIQGSIMYVPSGRGED